MMPISALQGDPQAGMGLLDALLTLMLIAFLMLLALSVMGPTLARLETLTSDTEAQLMERVRAMR